MNMNNEHEHEHEEDDEDEREKVCAHASKASSSRPKGRRAFVHSNLSIASNHFFRGDHCKQTSQECVGLS